MPERFTCTQGHQWSVADGGDDRTPMCPFCGGMPVLSHHPSAIGDRPEETTESSPVWPIAEGGKPIAEPKAESRTPIADCDSSTRTYHPDPEALEGSTSEEITDPSEQRETKTDFEAPPNIPGYEIVGELGCGGMGIVYKARQISLSRFVALKMILAGENADTPELLRFVAEAEAAASLQHPNIVQIHEIGEHQGYLYFSLELVEGGTLGRRIAAGPLPPREAAQLVETLARAIHFAHQRGIVHRDLKPSNILLASSDQRSAVSQEHAGTLSALTADRCPLTAIPKIADFGLAKRLDTDIDHARPGTAVGTPTYMAPEQAVGRTEEIGPASDIYSLGAVLYAMLTGRPPFRGESSAETLKQVLGSQPLPPSRLQPKLPRDLETICLKCLEKQPQRRYASAFELADDLRRFLNDVPIRARPIGLVGRCWRWCRRRPWLVATEAVAGVMTVIGVAMLLSFALYHANVAQQLRWEQEQLRKENEQLRQRLRELGVPPPP